MRGPLIYFSRILKGGGIMTAVLALSIILFCMAVGDIVSAKTKALVPSVFVTACVFLVGFWYVLPKNIVDLAYLGKPFVILAMFLLITHMGTMMSIRELLSQWKTVLISLAGITGILAILLTVGVVVLGKDTAFVGAPPLTGGIVAAVLMQEAASAAGQEKLAILAILVYVAQGFVGYPITAVLLNKEGSRLLNEYRNKRAEGIDLLAEYRNKVEAPKSNGEKKSRGIKFIPDLPAKYNSMYITLLRLSVVAYAADIFTKFVNNNVFHDPKALSPLITCLVFGVIATEIGFTEKRALEKANVFGWVILSLMAFIFAGLNKATPAMLQAVIGPLAGVIAIGVLGLLIFAFIAGKLLKESPYMALPIALNALYGFPPNFILTNDVIKSLTTEEDERAYLDAIMMPKMLIGGFTSVTIASVVVAGIFASMLF